MMLPRLRHRLAASMRYTVPTRSSLPADRWARNSSARHTSSHITAARCQCAAAAQQVLRPLLALQQACAESSQRLFHSAVHALFTWVSLSASIQGKLHVWAMSDLHTDYADNMQWVRQLPAPAQHLANTLLLVAGDVSDDVATLRQTLQLLKQKYHHVAFVAGNHELWVKGSAARNGGAQDSVQKLQAVMDVCQELGVITSPTRFGALWVVPIISWHHKSWDKEPDIPGIPKAGAMTIGDYAACKWPEGLPGASQQGSDETAEWFDAYNELHNNDDGSWTQLWAEHAASSAVASTSVSHGGRAGSSGVHRSWTIQQDGGGVAGGRISSEPEMDVISFSHFLPHQSLLPEKRFLSYPNLAKAVGSEYLWRRLQQLRPLCHNFGHSHFAWSAVVEGVHCVQAPLCYPAERSRRGKSIVMDDAGWHAQHWPQSQQQLQQEEQMQQGAAGQPGTSQPASDQVCLWLPVLLYTASYEAVLVNSTDGSRGDISNGSSSDSSSRSDNIGSLLTSTGGSSSSSNSSTALAAGGLTNDSHNQQQQQQQRQGSPQATPYVQLTHNGLDVLVSSSQGSTSSTDAAAHYRITSWQSSTCPELTAMWSAYYEKEPRQPNNTQLAPWVLKRYSKFKRRAAAHGFHEAAADHDQADRG